MKLIATLNGHVDASAKSAFRKLCAEVEADGTKVVMQDDEARSLHVEGTWWFHGRWSFVPEGDGANVFLEVWCKGGAFQRVLATLPIKRALRELRAGWDDDMKTLSQPLE